MIWRIWHQKYILSVNLLNLHLISSTSRYIGFFHFSICPVTFLCTRNTTPALVLFLVGTSKWIRIKPYPISLQSGLSFFVSVIAITWTDALFIPSISTTSRVKTIRDPFFYSSISTPSHCYERESVFPLLFPLILYYFEEVGHWHTVSWCTSTFAVSTFRVL